MKALSHRNLLVGLLVGLALLGANGLLSHRATRRLIENDGRVARSHEFIRDLLRALSTLQDAETGQRGYLLTGREPYLEPYRRARGELTVRLARLRRWSAGDPARERELDAFEAQVDRKVAELEETVELRRASGLGAALAVVETDVGKHTMDDIRRRIAALEREADGELAASRADSEASAREALATLWAAIFAAAALLLLLHGLVQRWLRERTASETALREQREWLRTTLASIGDAVLATDGEGRVTFINPVAESLTGWTEREARGRELTEIFRIVNERTRQTAENPVARALREGVVVGLANHTVLISRDGSETAIDDSAAPIRGSGGQVHGVVLVFRDVSQRYRQEREREGLLAREMAARAEAEAANHAKDEFLATVSHELRTPLSVIAGWAGILRTGSGDEATARRAAETIERNAWAQARIIEDILDVSRITSGKFQVEASEVDVAPLVASAVESLRPAAEAKGIALAIELDPGAGLVWGDPTRLQQVVWNLVSNAVKFTPRGGRVDVRLGRVDSFVEIAVRDTGAGISPEFLPNVFDRFRQADSSTTRKYGGLGLGLAIVRQLIELHGGTVEAASEGEGRGSTFTVRLPIRAVRRAPAPSRIEPLAAPVPALSPEIDSALAGLRALIVDDEPDAREMLAMLLRGCGAETRVASSAAEALAALADWRPDVLVSDIGMPGEDGYGLIRRVRALSPGEGGGIPAIALTAHARPEDRTHAFAAGFQAHVAKPVDQTELVRVIARLARRAR
jgi:PAS domain S-box-containing protein